MPSVTTQYFSTIKVPTLVRMPSVTTQYFFTIVMSAAGTAQWRAERLRLEDRGILGRFPTRTRYFSPLQEVQISSVDQIDCYSLGNGGAFPWVKMTRL